MQCIHCRELQTPGPEPPECEPPATQHCIGDTADGINQRRKIVVPAGQILHMRQNIEFEKWTVALKNITTAKLTFNLSPMFSQTWSNIYKYIVFLVKKISILDYFSQPQQIFFPFNVCNQNDVKLQIQIMECSFVDMKIGLLSRAICGHFFPKHGEIS